jgi:outer membrane protein
MKTNSLLYMSAALGLAVIASPASAYEEMSTEVATKAGGGFVGIAGVYRPDYEGSDDYEAYGAPFGKYQWASGRYISLGGTSGSERAGRLKANILATDTGSIWQFGPLLQYRPKRDDVENNKVDKLKSVDAATEAGAFIGLDSGPWTASISFATDVSDEHDGSLLYFNGGYDIPVNERFKLNLGAQMTWASDDYMETYFGVKPKNSARSGLPKYTASSGIKNAGMSLTGFYSFNKTWGLLGNVSYTRMLNDAEDSPLVNKVGDKNQYVAVLGITYAF